MAERKKSQSITRIFPVIRYRDARASIDWLVRAFGFEKQAEYDGPNGTIKHAEIAYGAGALSIASAGPPDSANPWSSVTQGIYVRVDDTDAHHNRAQAAGAGQLPASGEDEVRQFVNVVVADPDAHHARAKAAGASIVIGPQDSPFGARFYGARDPEGFLWWISTYRPAEGP